MGRKATSHTPPSKGATGAKGSRTPGKPQGASGKPPGKSRAAKAPEPSGKPPGKSRAATTPASPARSRAAREPAPTGKPEARSSSSKPKAPRAPAAKAPGKPAAAKAPGKPGKAKTPTKTPGAPAASRQRDIPRLLEILAQTWSEAKVELDHESAYELLVATILAAQATDKRINQVTPALFAAYPNARALAAADQAELEEQIRSTGFFRMKAKHLLGMARTVVERHDGEIPRTMDELLALPGVARKTANVVLGSFFGIPSGIVVDTHVARLARRLGLTEESDPEKIERDLMAVIPRDRWIDFAHQLIWHGRRICFARKPACDICPVAPLCPSAGIGARAVPETEGAPAAMPEPEEDDAS